ncbi:MAG: hypothetical protein AAF223_04960, partial [Bacteroidota bacterium]
WGVADSINDIPKWFRWFIDNSNIGVAYQDHERQEKILSKSSLDWTISPRRAHQFQAKAEHSRDLR